MASIVGSTNVVEVLLKDPRFDHILTSEYLEWLHKVEEKVGMQIDPYKYYSDWKSIYALLTRGRNIYGL
jgi:hypothetical protein